MIEGDEFGGAQPATLIGDDAVGKVAAGVQQRQAGLCGGRFTATFGLANSRRMASLIFARGSR